MSEGNKGVKRKKRSFMQKTMKFYKKGIHGKGVHINDETFEYFLHILKVLNQEFDSEEDKSMIFFLSKFILSLIDNL